jgi:hypothetical protein
MERDPRRDRGVQRHRHEQPAPVAGARRRPPQPRGYLVRIKRLLRVSRKV